jgi:hypothetical protein
LIDFQHDGTSLWLRLRLRWLPYYDDELFTINFKEMPSEGNLLNHNKNINTICMSDRSCPFSDFGKVRKLAQLNGYGFHMS